MDAHGDIKALDSLFKYNKQHDRNDYTGAPPQRQKGIANRQYTP